jgi:hypothetical protein
MTRRIAGVRLGTAVATITVLAAAAFLPASSAAHSRKPAFATGSYVGTTSQGQPIQFKIAKAKCTSPSPPYKLHKATCFVGELYATADYYPKVLEPCSDGSTYSDPLYAASYDLSLSSSGAMTYSVKGLGSTVVENASISMLSVHVKGTKASGTLHQTESYDAGNGTISCDSGPVTFTAKKAQ